MNRLPASCVRACAQAPSPPLATVHRSRCSSSSFSRLSPLARLKTRAASRWRELPFPFRPRPAEQRWDGSSSGGGRRFGYGASSRLDGFESSGVAYGKDGTDRRPAGGVARPIRASRVLSHSATQISGFVLLADVYGLEASLPSQLPPAAALHSGPLGLDPRIRDVCASGERPLSTFGDLRGAAGTLRRCARC